VPSERVDRCGAALSLTNWGWGRLMLRRRTPSRDRQLTCLVGLPLNRPLHLTAAFPALVGNFLLAVAEHYRLNEGQVHLAAACRTSQRRL
jgi:hypothetical protein